MSWLSRTSRRFRQALAGVLTLVAVSIGAIIHVQPDTDQLDLPSVQMVDAGRMILMQNCAVTARCGVIHARAGYVWDGASIPDGLPARLLGLDRFSMELRAASLYHDLAYQGQWPGLSKDQADAALEEVALRNGCEPHKARAIREYVRDFGGRYWDDATPETIAEARRWAEFTPTGEAK